MEVNVRYLQEDPKTGVLRFRRLFPVRLRPFVSDDGRPLTELKISLEGRSINDPGVKTRHEAALAKYEAMVARAQKLADRSFDHLDAPLIQYLADNFLHRHLELDEASRWRQPAPDFPFETRRDYETDYNECREMLADYDAEGLVGYWRDWAVSYAQAMGYTFDTSTKAFEALCRALGEASCRLWLAIDKRIDRESAPTPAAPVPPVVVEGPTEATVIEAVPAPAGGRSFEQITLAIIDKPRMGFKEPTKERVRGGLRFLKEAVGELTPHELTRERVTYFLDLLAQRPSKLPAADYALNLLQLAERYADKPEVPRLAQKTLEAYVLALNARWKEAQSEGSIPEDLVSPFGGRKFKRTSSAPRTAVGFSAAELEAYFKIPAFQERDRPTRGKGEAIYWLPLLLMYTGARPEEVAQLLVSDIYQDGQDGKWVIRFTDEGMHPAKGKQSLKTEGQESGKRTFPVHETLIALGILDYRKHLTERGETALFPLLRRKGKRSGIYASFGEWMCEYVYDNGVLPRGMGRQPVREFRHTWSTAARSSRLPREAMEYIQGHKAPGGGSANEGYGERDALGDWIGDVKFRVDVLELVPRWKP